MAKLLEALEPQTKTGTAKNFAAETKDEKKSTFHFIDKQNFLRQYFQLSIQLMGESKISLFSVFSCSVISSLLFKTSTQNDH
jgi:hypothetical protein